VCDLARISDPEENLELATVGRCSRGMDMRSNFAVAAVLAGAASLACPLALAQASAPTRAEVKAETRAAEKAGTLPRPGELGGPRIPAPTGTPVNRTDRKKATRDEEKAGLLTPAGASNRADNAIRAQKTTRSRTERKAETRAANKKGTLVPAGQGPDSAPK
jgi:uncharacterized protein DUF4148